MRTCLSCVIPNMTGFSKKTGYSRLSRNRTVYGDTVEMKLSKGDTSYVYLNHYDYARYDFSSMMQKPATLKLWLATKRGGDDE